jgi:hypothetical protein
MVDQLLPAYAKLSFRAGNFRATGKLSEFNA